MQVSWVFEVGISNISEENSEDSENNKMFLGDFKEFHRGSMGIEMKIIRVLKVSGEGYAKM